MKALLAKLTVEQWRAIDAQYIDRSLPGGRAAVVLLTVALSLALQRYFGKPGFIAGVDGARELFASWPQPGLYPHLYWALFKLLSYFVLPALCIKLVLRENIGDYGLGKKTSRGAWLLYFGMLALVIPMAYGASFTDGFVRTYPKYREAADSLWGLLAWELAYGSQFFLLEFFLRGFMIFALARHVGALSIFIMVVPYAMMHYSKPPAECFGSILAGIALGTIALRTRSIYGGVFVHCGVAWSMDLFSLWQQGKLQRLLEAGGG
ncbi:MAG: CPBP family intramembrane metalloprotease [Myxococcales bacterium]|nr:CPBP family intramembrane metalloprotease [Myxococcales bacterium]